MFYKHLLFICDSYIQYETMFLIVQVSVTGAGFLVYMEQRQICYSVMIDFSVTLHNRGCSHVTVLAWETWDSRPANAPFSFCDNLFFSLHAASSYCKKMEQSFHFMEIIPEIHHQI